MTEDGETAKAPGMHPETPADLEAALVQVPDAHEKWLALDDEERRRYIAWVNGPSLLRSSRIKGTVNRVLWDRPQLGFWGRMREGASTMGDEISSGNYPPIDGSP